MIKFVKIMCEALSNFLVEKALFFVGLVLFILWFRGMEEAFFGGFLLLYAPYTAWRLNDAKRRGKELINKIKKLEKQ